MLSQPIALNKIDAAEIIPCLYEIFHRDFIASRVTLAGTIRVDPQTHRKSDGKEEFFWHLTSRDQYDDTYVNGRRIKKLVGRYPDMNRAARLEWVRQIIDAPHDECVCMFYFQESNAKKDIRLYLWAPGHDFVVILQKLGRSSAFLVTSFYIDNSGKRQTYQKRFDAYTAGNNPALKNCEWF